MGARISVIVPVYNVEKYLNRCVESIVAQSYRDLEIILVNDGSTDCSGQICDDWAKKDPRIRVIHKANGGLSDARNCGISASSGEYIAFVDSDDFISPEMIDNLYRAIKYADTKLAICGVLCVNEFGIPVQDSNCFPIPTRVLTAEQLLPLFYEVGGTFYIVAWNKLYHRSLVSDAMFPVGKWHEDEYVAAQIIWRAERIACIADKGYHYVVRRPGSIMAEQHDVRHLDALEALLIRYRFYQEIGQTELLHETRARVLKVLEQYFWGAPSTDSAYHNKMLWLRREYGKLTGLPMKEWLKWKAFQISPKLERLFVGVAGRKKSKNI